MRQEDHELDLPPAPRPLDYEGPLPITKPARQWVGTFGAAATIAAIVVLAVAVILPQLGGASDQAVRISCAANLRTVGQGLLMYANEHRGRFPETVEQLYLSGLLLDPRVLTCPGSAEALARGPTTQAVVPELAAGGHVSYAYLGAGLRSNAHRNTVLMYEPASNHQGRGGNVLFVDGHVEFMDRDALGRLAALHAVGAGPVARDDLFSGTPIPARAPETRPTTGAVAR